MDSNKNALLGMIGGAVLGYGGALLLAGVLNISKIIGAENMGGWMLYIAGSVIIFALIGGIIGRVFPKLLKIIVIFIVIIIVGYCAYSVINIFLHPAPPIPPLNMK